MPRTEGAWWRQKGGKRSSQQSSSHTQRIENTSPVSPIGILPSYTEMPSTSSGSSSNQMDSDQAYELDPGFVGTRHDLNFEDFLHATQPPSESVGMIINAHSMNAYPSPLSCQKMNPSSDSTEHAVGFNDLYSTENFEDVLQIDQEGSKVVSEADDSRRDSDQSYSTCPCFGIVLEALQGLQECFSEINNPYQDMSAVGFATILQNNERTMKCCLMILRCQICGIDQGKSPFVLLFTLIRKEVSLMEDWVYSHQNGSTINNSSSTRSAGDVSDRNLKIQVAKVGTSRLREILIELRRACQFLTCNITRLAHTLLVESLAARLRNTFDRLNVEANLAGFESAKTTDDVCIRDHCHGQYQVESYGKCCHV